MRRKRADILAVVLRAESAVEREIESANKEFRQSTRTFARKEGAKQEYLELKDSLREKQEARVGRHMALLGDVSAQTEQLRSQHRLDKERMEHLAPPAWRTAARKAQRLLKSEGYDNRTGWRGRTKALLQEVHASMEGSFGRGAAASLRARELVRKINIYAAAELGERLDAVCDAGDEALAATDPAHAELRGRVTESARQLTTLEKTLAARAAIAKARAGREQSVAKHRLRALEKEYSAPPPQFDFSTMGTASLAADLADLQRETLTRDTRARLQGRYNRLLGRCSQYGAWQEAFDTFSALVEMGLEADTHTYCTLISACKNAKPCQAAKAVEIFEMMVAQGVPPSTQVYNVVIGACSVGGRWREALALFKRMQQPPPPPPPQQQQQQQQQQPCVPNTATYAGLVDVCRRCSLDEVPQLYDAMKFAGVPEYIAYSAGRERMSRKGPPSPSKSYFALDNADLLVRNKQREEDLAGESGAIAAPEPSPLLARRAAATAAAAAATAAAAETSLAGAAMTAAGDGTATGMPSSSTSSRSRMAFSTTATQNPAASAAFASAAW
jgi:pentatricopeptide repeat protein